MSTAISNLAKRLPFRTIPRPFNPSKHSILPRTVNISTVKARTSDWEPGLQLKDLTLNESKRKEDDNGNGGVGRGEVVVWWGV